MQISDINLYGWIFLASLAVFLFGLLGWYINRSMVELAARLDRSEETPKFSYFQQWLLPKYRAGQGRFANEEFREDVDQRARNRFAQIALLLMLIGALMQISLWVYLFNFTNGQVSFIG